MKRNDILINARYAGQVRRYHTWLVHQEQTVGEHSWNCIRIWWQIWGPLPPEVTTYFLWHDAGELVCGDLPFPVKSKQPILKSLMDELETSAIENMGGSAVNLEGIYKVRVKAVDLIDMHEFGKTELLMGNQFAHPIVEDTFKALDALPLELNDRLKISTYLSERTGVCMSLQHEV